MTVREVARASALLWGATLVAALVVAAIPGAPSSVRRAFAFGFEAAEAGTWADVGTYLSANLRVTAAILLASWARPRSGPAGLLLDIVVGAIAASNAAVVGVALGAYGARAIPWLVHLPLEWCALALALTCYLCGRRQTIRARTCVSRGIVVSVLLVWAAGAEAFATP